jgi:hypothetical protein
MKKMGNREQGTGNGKSCFLAPFRVCAPSILLLPSPLPVPRSPFPES